MVAQLRSKSDTRCRINLSCSHILSYKPCQVYRILSQVLWKHLMSFLQVFSMYQLSLLCSWSLKEHAFHGLIRLYDYCLLQTAVVPLRRTSSLTDALKKRQSSVAIDFLVQESYVSSTLRFYFQISHRHQEPILIISRWKSSSKSRHAQRQEELIRCPYPQSSVSEPSLCQRRASCGTRTY